jgi:hypothetical protein
MLISEDQLEKLKRAYQILGVPLFASAPSIKRAYWQLIKRWHPDRYPSGGSSHAEASQMTRLINQAYAEIEHAPLRYYSGDIPRVQQRIDPVSRGTPDAARQAVPKTDQLEFWVRFVCGSLLGLFVSFRLFLYAFDRPTIPAAIMVGGVVFGCGFGAARYGDKFWHSILRYWWFWS